MTTADILRTAAAWRPPEDATPEIAIAAAQYQESVFRTIDVVIRRGEPAASFDAVVASAVDEILGPVMGLTAVCNARIRATVAILRTAARIVSLINGPSATKDALLPLYDTLRGSVSRWRNPGIAEGCFRALPSLLSNPAHHAFHQRALDALLHHAEPPADMRDLARVHLHLAAAACFRRVLVMLAELQSESVQPAEARRLEAHIATLFANPSIQRIHHAFRPGKLATPGASRGTSDLVIAGTSFDASMLQAVRAAMKRWGELEPVDRVALMRIVALQLKSATGEWHDVERFPLLRRHYERLSTVFRTAPERAQLLWTLLAELPAEAAESMDAEVQAFVEHAERHRAAETDGLPGHVVAMISRSAGSRITDLIVREIDLRLRHARLKDQSFDLGALLYEVFLRDPDERLFDHLLPRLSRPDDRAMTMLFRDLIAAMHHAEGDERMLIDAAESFAYENTALGPAVRAVRNALIWFLLLTAADEHVWVAISNGATGGLGALFEAFDKLANRRPPLAASLRDRLVGIERDIEFYLRLPVEEFEGRAHTLERARRIADSLAATVTEHAELHAPERIFLSTAIRHLRGLFDRAMLWSCEEPQRQRKAGRHETFWPLFAADSAERDSDDSELQNEMQRLNGTAGREPPPYPGQRRRFEGFFVEWLSSEINADALAQALRPRWPLWFRMAFTVMTRFSWISILILMPCVFAALMHAAGNHDLEGGGFFIVSLAIGAATLFALSPIARMIAEGWGDRSRPSEYRFECMFPRVAGFIAAPMALVIEFEHAYQFPIEASTPVLVVLMIVAVLAIRVTATKAVGAGDDESVDRRVRRIVAIALSQSFVIALLLSLIFGGHVDKLVQEMNERHLPPPRHSAHHQLPDFLGVLPRDVAFDVEAFAERTGLRKPIVRVRPFVFYPTIILTWTALGLLFGVVFEGFLKGAKVRGERALEHET